MREMLLLIVPDFSCLNYISVEVKPCSVCLLLRPCIHLVRQTAPYTDICGLFIRFFYFQW